jgi:predicted AAA+ superfamily ATPase
VEARKGNILYSWIEIQKYHDIIGFQSEVIMYIERKLGKTIRKRFFAGKAILLYGPRQCGKTTLIEEILRPDKGNVLFLSGDEPDVREMLGQITSTRLKSLLGKKKLLVIDEAQRIPGVGLTIKLVTDQIKEVQIIATGSSALDLAEKTSEPLTGRKFEFTLLPLSFGELAQANGTLEERRLLPTRLVFGSYPDIVVHADDATALLRSLAGSYLYKDLLMLEQIKKPVLLEKLVRALALQCGAEVSFHELGQLVGADQKTVEKYVDLLEKAYVVFTLPAFSRNMRNEIRKSRKIFFYDCGIRNAVLGNFLPLESRTDVGVLWENYLQAERRKLVLTKGSDARGYFWRTTDQKEVDYVEESSKGLAAYEFKWRDFGRTRIPKKFMNAYPESSSQVITPDQIEDFLEVK